MAVYVDKMRAPYRRMVMCHMVADTLAELHAMADYIGVDRRHFQSASSIPHYDICLTKRRLAVACGAREIGRRELVTVIRGFRNGKDDERA